MHHLKAAVSPHLSVILFFFIIFVHFRVYTRMFVVTLYHTCQINFDNSAQHLYVTTVLRDFSYQFLVGLVLEMLCKNNKI